MKIELERKDGAKLEVCTPLEDYELEMLDDCEIVGVFLGELETNFSDFFNSLDEVNEVAEKLGEENEEIVETMLDDFDILEVADIVSDGNYAVHLNCETMADVAREVIEESALLEEVPKELRDYIDYEKYGRELAYDNTFIKSDYGFIVEVFL